MDKLSNKKFWNDPLTWSIVGLFPVGTIYFNFSYLFTFIDDFRISAYPDSFLNILGSDSTLILLGLQIISFLLLFSLAYVLLKRVFTRESIDLWDEKKAVKAITTLMLMFVLSSVYYLLNILQGREDYIFRFVAWVLDPELRDRHISLSDLLSPETFYDVPQNFKIFLFGGLQVIRAVVDIKFLYIWISALANVLSKFSADDKSLTNAKTSSKEINTNDNSGAGWKEFQKPQYITFSHVMAILLFIGIFVSIVIGIFNLNSIYLESYSSQIRKMSERLTHSDSYKISTSNIISENQKNKFQSLAKLANDLDNYSFRFNSENAREIVKKLIEEIAEIESSTEKIPLNEDQLKASYAKLTEEFKKLSEVVKDKPDDDWEILVLRTGVVMFFVFLATVFIKLFMSIRRSLERDQQHWKAVEVISNITTEEEFKRYFQVSTTPIQVSKESTDNVSDDTLKLLKEVIQGLKGKT